MPSYWIITLIMAACLVHFFNTRERPRALPLVTFEVNAEYFD